MAGILKVDQYQDFNGNNIMTSDGSGNITVNAAAMKNTPAFFAYKSSNQSLSNNTQTTLTYDSIDYNTDSFWDTSTNKATIPSGQAGKYFFNCDLTAAAANSSGGTASSSTRGLIGLGYVAPARTNRIDFCTIATTGDATDFGDLTHVRNNYGSLSNSNRGVFLGGNDPFVNTIDFVLIASTGDATHFGDVSIGVSGLGAAGSNCHGGLS